MCRVAQQWSWHFGTISRKNNEGSSHCGEHGQGGLPIIRSVEWIADDPNGSRWQHSLWEAVDSTLAKQNAKIGPAGNPDYSRQSGRIFTGSRRDFIAVTMKGE